MGRDIFPSYAKEVELTSLYVHSVRTYLSAACGGFVLALALLVYRSAVR